MAKTKITIPFIQLRPLAQMLLDVLEIALVALAEICELPEDAGCLAKKALQEIEKITGEKESNGKDGI